MKLNVFPTQIIIYELKTTKIIFKEHQQLLYIQQVHNMCEGTFFIDLLGRNGESYAYLHCKNCFSNTYYINIEMNSLFQVRSAHQFIK